MRPLDLASRPPTPRLDARPLPATLGRGGFEFPDGFTCGVDPGPVGRPPYEADPKPVRASQEPCVERKAPSDRPSQPTSVDHDADRADRDTDALPVEAVLPAHQFDVALPAMVDALTSDVAPAPLASTDATAAPQVMLAGGVEVRYVPDARSGVRCEVQLPRELGGGKLLMRTLPGDAVHVHFVPGATTGSAGLPERLREAFAARGVRGTVVVRPAAAVVGRGAGR